MCPSGVLKSEPELIRRWLKLGQLLIEERTLPGGSSICLALFLDLGL
jgi:hypothetical protein